MPSITINAAHLDDRERARLLRLAEMAAQRAGERPPAMHLLQGEGEALDVRLPDSDAADAITLLIEHMCDTADRTLASLRSLNDRLEQRMAEGPKPWSAFRTS